MGAVGALALVVDEVVVGHVGLRQLCNQCLHCLGDLGLVGVLVRRRLAPNEVLDGRPAGVRAAGEGRLQIKKIKKKWL